MTPGRTPYPARASVTALVLAVVLMGCGTDPGTPRGSDTGRGASATAAPRSTTPLGPGRLPAGIDAVVTSVTDGDTVVVRTAAGVIERVRLIGIDTPETVDPRRPVECFGREASERTATLLPPGTPVRLELDVEQRDRYGRLLAYVWRAADVTFVNAALVEGGWAAPYRYPPNVRYADLLRSLGSAARAADRGLWRACDGTDTPASGRSVG